MVVLRPPFMRLLLGAALVFAPAAAKAQAPSTPAPVAPRVKAEAPEAGAHAQEAGRGRVSAPARAAAPSEGAVAPSVPAAAQAPVRGNPTAAPAPDAAQPAEGRGAATASAPAEAQAAPAAAPVAAPAAPSAQDAALLEADRALDAELAAREAKRQASAWGSSEADALAESEESENLGWALVRTLLVLGVVVASIYLTLNVGLRKLMGLQGAAMGRQPLVSVVERLPLDQRRSLFVVKAADEYLLVGGGEGGLQLLSKLDVEAVERIRAQRPQTNAVSLSPFLQKLLSRRSGGSPSQPPGS
ncbi:flagellar biosynthetic protein FliO [Comamonas sp. JC664]|uniref:flagellar biosynthetic protein FliO n=1 Tax=Comamonas sp. JC664 TaxID=2801917 RepID=UPI00191FB4DB|nr:flagellar biosynthetic protein FliO [Comamonas sp. JC664]MBL0693285.1 FliO/MopB family protein [Comamonas sp. JC664]